MRKIKSIFKFIILTSTVIFAITILTAYSGGAPMGKTGSPGDNYINCSQCHNGPPQQALAWITTDIPASGYISGTTYTVIVTANHSGAVKAGFQLCAEDNSNQKQGELIPTNLTETKLTGTNHITHTSNGVTCIAGQRSWSFDWKAPTAGTGEITFYNASFLSTGGQYNGMTYLSDTSVQEATTGISNINKSNEIDIWYDSNNHLIHYKFPDENCENINIEFYNIAGQKLDGATLSNNGSVEYHQEISLNYRGILIIRIESDSFRIVKKMFIP